MKLPSFDEFHKTITEEKSTSWWYDEKLEGTHKGQDAISVMAKINASLMMGLLGEYHSWLQAQIDDWNN